MINSSLAGRSVNPEPALQGQSVSPTALLSAVNDQSDMIDSLCAAMSNASTVVADIDLRVGAVIHP